MFSVVTNSLSRMRRNADSTFGPQPLRIGILGFGHLGQFLCAHFERERGKPTRDFDLVFIWNRSKQIFSKYDKEINRNLIVSTVQEGLQRVPDIVVEVAHPDVIKTYAEQILDVCDLFIGSPTALAYEPLLEKLKKKTMETGQVVYIASGAFWGAEDITKMTERDLVRSLTITMKKHPDSFKLNEPLRSKLLYERARSGNKQEEIVIYSGPVRELCRLAPNNVNTMAVGAIVADHLGFDGVQGRLIADSSLTDRHIVEIELSGPETMIGDRNQTSVYIKTTRINPAEIGFITGTSTLLSFVSSIKRARGQISGIHIV
jgi:predicted dinucleotide-utilizing enzyme